MILPVVSEWYQGEMEHAECVGKFHEDSAEHEGSGTKDTRRRIVVYCYHLSIYLSIETLASTVKLSIETLATRQTLKPYSASDSHTPIALRRTTRPTKLLSKCSTA